MRNIKEELPRNDKSCVIFGSTGLCIACIEELLSAEWNVRIVVTQDQEVLNWAFQNQIRTVSYAEYKDFSIESSYLFSIVNPFVLSNDILGSVTALAINYHDAPLPKYAGLNSTAWAIFNEEVVHGVTWHLINADSIDTGDIIAQKQFPISEEDTTFSLNIQCTKYALSEFKKLLIKIKNGLVEPRVQDLSQRTYYSQTKTVPNFGIVDFSLGVEKAKNLQRMLDFGGYHNPLATFKIWIFHQAFIICRCAFNYCKSDKAAGSILEMTEKSISVAFEDGVIEIFELCSLYGEPVKLGSLGIKEGDILDRPVLPEFLNIKDFPLLKYLRKYTPPVELLSRKEKSFKSVEIPFVSGDEFFIIACIMAYFSRIQRNEFVSFDLLDRELFAHAILIDHLPITLDCRELFRDTIFGLALKIKALIAESTRCQKDLYHRYGLPVMESFHKVAFIFDQFKSVDFCAYGISFFIHSNNCHIISLVDLPPGFLESLQQSVKHLYLISKNSLHVGSMPLIPVPEYENIVYRFNQTEWDFPTVHSLQTLFQTQVHKTPERIAVVSGDESISYRQLNERANQLARYIKRQYAIRSEAKLKPGALIGVCLKKSIDMVIALLGILKAGAAYVPLDPSYPKSRTRYILKDAAIRMILTDTSQKHYLSGISQSICIFLDSMPYLTEIYTNLRSSHKADDLAYVIYTSGTTGIPKGVMVSHGNVINLIYNIIDMYSLCSHLRCAQFARIVFDASVYEIFPCLCAGSELYIIAEDMVIDPKKLMNYLDEQAINLITLPPAIFETMKVRRLSSLKKIVLAGDVCDLKTIERWSRYYEIVNAYGPTECTVYSTSSVYVLGKSNRCIGKPIKNVQAYILDEELMPLPVGVVGDLYIGGAGVAKGYLNRDELTREKFIPNPFLRARGQESGSSCLYKTGDLARCLPDGSLEYFGRNDFQIKLRGYRIELAEIESALSKIKPVRQSVVIVKGKVGDLNSQYLVAYYVSDFPLSSEYIVQELANTLLDYMIPKFFVYMSVFPLTINGKIDREALPEPHVDSRGEYYLAPQSELEMKLCSVWEELLNITQVGIRDDFFKAGGDSLMAIQLCHKVEKLLETDCLSIVDVYEQRTIENLARTLNKKLKIKNIHFDIPHLNRQIAPLSYSQERLWFIEKYEGGTNAYHIPILLEIPDHIKGRPLKRAIIEIVRRHAALRSILKEMKNGIYQQKILKRPLKIKEISIESDHSQASLSKELESVLLEEINLPFSLEIDYPVRVILMQVKLSGKHQRYLLFNFHHISFDGWSIKILLDELGESYRAYALGQKPMLSSPKIQYADYAAWQREYFTGAVLTKGLNYWKDQLAGYENLNLRFDRPRGKKIDYRGKDLYFDLGERLSKKIEYYSKENGVSIYVLMLATFYVLLMKYTGQHNLVVGLPIANRHYPKVKDLIGFFVNTLAIRLVISENQNFFSILEALNQKIQEAQEFQEIPFGKIVEVLGVAKDPSMHPIFQVMFAIENFIGIEKHIKDYGTIIDVANLQGCAKFDLSVLLDVSNETIKGKFNYALALFDETTVVQMRDHYVRLLKILVQEPHLSLSEISLLSKREYQKIVNTFNRTEHIFTEEPDLLHHLFEKQAVASPASPAVVFEGKTLTYAELNQKANQLARHIRKVYYDLSGKELVSNTLIAISLERGLEMVTGILAILKAGAVYVPIDPSFPESRIKFILNDVKAEIFINHDFLTREVYTDEENSNLALELKNTDLAYVIYTSGTTGHPKGVMIEHKAAANLICTFKSRYKMHEGARISQYSSCVFDVSVFEIFYALVQGACLFILEDMQRKDTQLLTEFIGENMIEYIFLPPAVLANLPRRSYKHLKSIFYAGEPCNIEVVDYWSKNTELYNCYGPTEATIYATVARMSPGSAKVIGWPIHNTKLYVLDQALKPVPIGVVGELYIGGVGLARGYLNRPDLTQERFIQNPFANQEGKINDFTRLYKTGDLVCWLPDGSLEYEGRNDSQIKLRGYRIELGEIEAALSTLEPIDQSVVLAKDRPGGSNAQYLVAYYVAKYPLSDQTLTRELANLLPEYMVPKVFIHMKALPVTVSGKIDRKALPEPHFEIDDSMYIGPRNNSEKVLCKIWEDLLAVSPVGVKDDFFKIGGDSILSIQLISRLKSMGFHCQVKDIFDYRTVELLVEHIEKKRAAPKIDAPQGLLEGKCVLLPIQQWFFEQCDRGFFQARNHWNQAFLIKVPALDIKKLNTVVDTLITHHDLLRVKFKKSAGQQVQFYQKKSVRPRLEVFNISSLNEQGIHVLLTKLQSGFDIEKGVLWKMACLHGYADGSARIFFAAHHLIIDAVSWRIILEDIETLYHDGKLGEKTSSYQQWSDLIKSYPLDHAEEMVFWRSLLKSEKSSFFEKFYGLNTQRWKTITLDQRVTRDLLYKGNSAYHTQINDLLLSALAYALTDLSGDSTHIIHIEGHGRESIKANIDVSRTVGWFTTIFPSYVKSSKHIAETIKYTKEHLRSLPNKGLGYGAFKYGFPDKILGDLGKSPVSFNYLGQLSTKEGFWQLTSESVGECRSSQNLDPYMININGGIYNGLLQFWIASRMPEEEANQFILHFQKNIQKIIEHCIEVVDTHRIEYTISDFKFVQAESDLALLPMLPGSVTDQLKPFPMTEIQFAYLIGRQPSFEIGNVANHLYREFYYEYLDVARLQNALNKLICLHPELRTVFDIRSLEQRYLPLSEIPVYVVEILDLQKPFDPNDLIETREVLSCKKYDVSQFPLFTFTVSKFHDVYVLHVSFDLIILDVESRQALFEELTLLYNHPYIEIEPPKLNFKDYQNYLSYLKYSLWYKKDKEYWDKKIKELPLRTELPFKVRPEKIKNPKFKLNKHFVEKTVWDQFKCRVEQYGVSCASALISLYAVSLSRYMGADQVLLTLTLFNRYFINPEVEKIWGDFTSTLLLGVQTSKESFSKIVKKVHDDLWEGVAHGLYPGVLVQRDLARLHSLNPVSAVSPLVFTGRLGGQQDLCNKILDASEKIDRREIIAQTSQAWIDLQAVEWNGGLLSGWLYVSQLFDADLVDNLNEYFCHLITYFAEKDWSEEIPAFLSRTQLRILENANSAVMELPTKTLIEAFEDQVRKKPHAIAVIHHDKLYTYIQLDKYAQHIAERLYASDKNKPLIAILCEKGFDQIASVIAVLKVGGAYLPLNVEWPVDRLSEILIEGNVSHVLASAIQVARLKKTPLTKKVEITEIDQSLVMHSTGVGKRPKIKKPSLSDIAYVIFTSGSTGKPKGVAVSHLGAMNTIQAVNARYGIDSSDRILALSELSFDLSVYDLFGMFYAGGTVVCPTQDKVKSPMHWRELALEYNVTIWNSVPQLMDLMAEVCSSIPSLKVVLLSGDWIPLSLPDKVKDINSGVSIVSLGGATEASIWSIWFEIDAVKKGWLSIPYGKAMPNQKIYVLNSMGRHCPIGVMGEVYIGGHGVAAGYWGDVKRTEESFISHPQLGRLYRTGDLGKWHNKGYLELFGRKDSQVKINGYRVEINEIVARLEGLAGVKNVLVQLSKNKVAHQLVAYIVPDYLKESDIFLVSPPSILKIPKLYRMQDMEKEVLLHSRQTWASSLLDEIYLLSILNLFHYIMPKAQVGDVFDLRQLMLQQDIPEYFIRWLRRSAHHLCVSGYLETSTYEDHYRILKFFPEVKLSQVTELLRDNAIENADYLIECFQNLLGLLQGVEATKYYVETVDISFYKKIFNLEYQIADRLISQILEIRKTPISVLEVGAGYGSLTESFLKHMNQQGDCYIFSDISTFFFEKARNTFEKYHCIEYKKYDLDIDPVAQGFKEDQYDIVLGNNVLHDVQNLGATLRNIGRLLKDKGYIFILEYTKFYRHYDLGMGLQKGFDAFADERVVQPLLSLNEWSRVLKDAGFTEVTVQKISRFTDSDDVDFIVGVWQINKVASKILNEKAITNALKATLPEYMVPQIYITLKEIPVTQNGKVDYRLLPKVNLIQQQGEHHPPRNEYEHILCQAWQKFFGRDFVSIKDDFFDLGGDSLLAIQIASHISGVTAIEISLPDIYANKTIEQLASYISCAKMQSELIKPFYLTRAIPKRKICFIHPGHGGCEVYQNLAERLAGQYDCIGIDNLNLIKKEKISDLRDIAKTYVSYIQDVLKEDKEVVLCGWSVGGHIALEMANYMEELGLRKIKVYLLDTTLPDAILSKIKSSLYQKEMRYKLRSHLLSKGYNSDYVRRVIDSLPSEIKLSGTPITSKLKSTEVTLFKALQVDNRFDLSMSPKLNEYILSLKDNNIFKVTDRPINIIYLDCNHSNILEQSEIISKVIAKD